MLTDQALRGYEKYLISERNLEETLNILPANSEDYLFLKLLHILQTQGVSPFKDDKDIKEQYKTLKDSYYSDRSKMVQAREILLSYDAATTSKDKETALNRLKDFVHWSFDYTKPTNLKKIKKTNEEVKGGEDDTSEEEDEELRRYTSNFKAEEEFNRQVLCDSFISSNQATSIHPRYFPVMDYSKMTHYRQFEYFIQNGVIPHVDFADENKSFEQKLKEALKEEHNKHLYQVNYLLPKYGINDLLKLRKQFSQFDTLEVNVEVTRRQFFREFYDQQFSAYSFEKQSQTIEQIEEFVAKHFGRDADLTKAARFYQLVILYNQNKFDEKLFTEWVKSPHYTHSIFVYDQYSNYNSSWNSVLNGLNRVSLTDGQLIEKVMEVNLEHCLVKLDMDITKKYGKYIREYNLQYFKARIDYLNNRKLDDNSTAQSVTQQLQHATYIQICHYNKSQCRLDEEIQVWVDIKNIQKMQVKIFEINTDNYFRKNMSTFTSDINLDGLIAKHEQECNYADKPSNLRHTERFTFPAAERGLFVVEFIGNGLSSRAIIQKGSLSLIHKSTIAGHFAFILDENKNICKGQYTGLYFDNNFYPTDLETGRIVIPFGRHSYVGKAIMIYEGFAQLTDFKREDERYQFYANFILHNESVIMGNLAKILVKPSLILNERELADLRLLEKTKVTLQTVNKVDNITISKSYEDVKLNSNEEYEIEFQVPPNIAEINVTVSTMVNIVSKSEKKNFSQSWNFTVNNHSNDYDFCEAFLRNVDGEYQYQIKGKNGEPKRGVLIDFNFWHQYYNSSRSKCLKTDKEGIVYLGRLKNILQFTATPRSSRIVRSQQKTWVLPQNIHLSYPDGQQLTVLTSEKIRLPFRHSEVKTTNLQLLQFSNSGSVYIENLFGKAKLVKNPHNKQGVNYIEISGLEEGQYQLWLKKEGVRLQITVHEGSYWNQSYEFLIKERAMIERTRQRIDCLRIDEVTINSVENDIDEKSSDRKHIQRVEVKIGGDYNLKNARIHAWAFKFYPYDLQTIVTDKLSNKSQLSPFSSTHFNFAQWKNIYLSNRQMSDENRYIMERKMQDKTIGNFLEKPTVLLKRNYIRDTTFTQEKLNQGSSYDRVQAESQKLAQVAASGSMAPGSKSRLSRTMPNPADSKRIEGFHNFLAHSAETFLNVKVEEGGFAEFEMNLEPYTSLLVTVTSDDQCSHLIVPLQTSSRKAMPQRDLSLLKAYNSEKSFAETRRTTNCLKSDKFVVEDITSTDMQIVDSLEKVWLIQKELKRFSNEEQEFIDNMLKWPTLNLEQKAKNYSEYCSHEFNVFLKLKDNAFFENAVRPFISNKIEKTIVDYWLLDFDFALSEFLLPHKLEQLNIFEVCLLIHFLMNNGGEGNIKRAQELSDSIQDRNNPPSIDAMNRIYDVVLNMNSLNSKPGDDVQALLAEEKQRRIKERDREDEQCRSSSKDMRAPSRSSMLCAMAPPPPPPGMGAPPISSRGGAMLKKEAEPERNMKRRALAKAEFEEECGALEMCSMDESSLSRADPFSAQMDYQQLQDIRKEQKLTFKELDNTKEYAETHYYKIKYRNQHKSLISANCFWANLARFLANHESTNANYFKNFLTSNFTLALSSINEAALAFALIDLPFKDESHGFRSGEGRSVEIKAASNMIIFLKEIQESQTDINKNLLVVQRYFEKDKMEREVQEFLINEVYTCQVIVTNISNKSISFQALVQIPEGSLPLYNSHYQKSHNFNLSAFSTMQFMYYFYFPKTGIFKHFPTNVSIERVVVAKATPVTIKVQRAQMQVNEDDFDDILATGSIPNILNFMRTKNILSSKVRFNLTSVYWLCKDATFYNDGIKILQQKNIFDHTFWSFAIMHNDLANMRVFFNSQQVGLKSRVGSQFKSGLVEVNQYEESHDLFNFLDYFPLVNARAHRVGGMESASSNSSSETKQWILNQNLRETYMRFMIQMVAKREWTAPDRLMFVNYLLMQERVTEAVAEFKKIRDSDFGEKRGDARIQYDYIKAYLDFYICGKNGSLDFTDARSIVGKYIDYPVLHWRVLFKEISDQLKEIDQSYKPQAASQSEAIKLDNFEDTEQERKRKQVKMEPQMDFTVDNNTKAIIIDYINVAKIRVNYYLIDLEILFSKTPFITSDAQDFSFVQPFQSEEISLDINQTTFKLPIPADLATKNLVIEVAANESNGIKQMKTYFSATLKVRVIENFGELKVFISNEGGQDIPLPKTYVKVYSKKVGGSVQFFKDGYTDLRGRFDYGQLSGTSISDVERFAIFVHNEQHGSLIKEAKPPAGAKK